MAMTAAALGRIGIWATELRWSDPGEISEAAAELEQLGYGALWFPGGIGGDVTGDFSRLLDATNRIPVATGIINIWKHEPDEIAAWWLGLPETQRSRALLGLGISHGPLIGEAWGKPLPVTRAYVERLTAAGVPAEHQCLAALGPKMLELARDRTLGSHPYLATPEHTAMARAILGPGKLLAPEQGVILETDPDRARSIGREALATYLALPNYRNNWLRVGFSEAEIESQADRLIDGLFAWGEPARIAERVHEHHAAGADHVCLQVLQATGRDLAAARGAWRQLAAELL